MSSVSGTEDDDLTARWLRTVAAALDVDDVELTDAAAANRLLDLARDAAHGVARPAAPLAAYAVGVAVGRGMSLEAAVAQVTALASRWQ
jgi:uncharacterized protein DUF6457